MFYWTLFKFDSFGVSFVIKIKDYDIFISIAGILIIIASITLIIF